MKYEKVKEGFDAMIGGHRHTTSTCKEIVSWTVQVAVSLTRLQLVRIFGTAIIYSYKLKSCVCQRILKNGTI